jgi:hypothetical protein
MDNTLALVIGAVIVALIVFAIVMGGRLVSGRIEVGKHFKGEVKGDVAPSVADENQLRGNKNQIGAVGDRSSASRNTVDGDENVISAKTK